MPVNLDYCFIIPCYNHGKTIQNLVSNLMSYSFKVIIVDDGSDSETEQEIIKVSKQYANVDVVRLPENGGKGAAVSQGIIYASKLGYQYALQIDADGQHNCEDIDKLLALSKKYPNDLISGKPIYDDSIPKGRLFARYITHFWVWIETLSFSIKDSMCGFRVYPINKTVNILTNYRVGLRMDFDIEIMVRLYWDNCNVRFIDTKVIYPEGGISHFKSFKDNVLITKMHTKLFFGMLPRAFKLIGRNKNAE